MKSFLLLILLSGFLFITPDSSFSQNSELKVFHFKHISKEEDQRLHSDYPKVSQVTFKSCNTEEERHAKVDKAWHDFWHNFTEYYHSKGVYGKRKNKVYVHMHFGENGQLEVFGYHFLHKENEFTTKFVDLLKEFAKDHTFDLHEGVRFSQCGVLHLLPRSGDIKEGL